MANPQIENGYLKIANELVEQFCKYRLSGEEWLILWTVIKKTYGYNKKQDAISLSQFTQMTGLKRSSVCRGINKLVSKKLLGSLKTETREVTSYYIIKDYEKWQPSLKIETSLKKETYKRQYNIVYTKLIKTFDLIWNKYPKRVGKKMAIKHFEASVKTKKDLDDINKALANYLSSKRVLSGYIQNGSTWFNNWRDWIDYTEESCKKCNDKGYFTSATGYKIICACPAGRSK